MMGKLVKKYIILFALCFGISLSFQNVKAELNPKSVKSIERLTELKDGYYLVVGVFSNEDNAIRYSKKVDSMGYKTIYMFSEVRKMFYCYVMKADTIAGIKDKYNELRQKKEFYSVWILQVKNHEETKILDIVTAEKNDKQKQEPPVVQPKVHHAHKAHHTAAKTAPTKPVRDLSATHNSYKVTITVQDQNNKVVPATIKVTHGEQQKVIASIKCNQEGMVSLPKKEDQLVQLICEMFGYHRTELSLPLQDPIALSALKNVKVEGDKITVDLTLDKLQTGDLMVMFNVFFHPNSNIMRLKSQTDLETLEGILLDNPSLRICVHGHTNGNSNGEIIKIKEDTKDFFAPKDVEHTKGSSMKLSLLRAEAIKMYLVSKGIAADRIDVKGWGGKKMLYNEDSPHYQMNVRVEVEVLDI